MRSILYRIKKHFSIHNHPLLYTYAQKKYYLNKNILSTETLVMGSSHGLYGYFPDLNRKEYNLSHSSEDLYYSYQMYMKHRNKLKELKTVVFFYSLFSKGLNLERTSESERCLFYNALYGIEFQNPSIFDDKKEVIKKINKDFSKLKFKKNLKYAGETDYKSFFNFIPSERAASHLKNHERPEIQISWLEKLIAAVHEDNKKIIIVVSPVSTDLIQHVPEEIRVFQELSSLSVPVYNFFDSNSFTNEDFGDTDHLNLQGAQKLTKLIREII